MGAQVDSLESHQQHARRGLELITTAVETLRTDVRQASRVASAAADAQSRLRQDMESTFKQTCNQASANIRLHVQKELESLTTSVQEARARTDTLISTLESVQATAGANVNKLKELQVLEAQREQFFVKCVALDDLQKAVRITVGESSFQTTVSTFMQRPSMLTAMVRFKLASLEPDSFNVSKGLDHKVDGPLVAVNCTPLNFFIDRPTGHFEAILTFLRTGKSKTFLELLNRRYPLDGIYDSDHNVSGWEDLLEDIEFYQVEGMIEAHRLHELDFKSRAEERIVRKKLVAQRQKEAQEAQEARVYEWMARHGRRWNS